MQQKHPMIASIVNNQLLSTTKVIQTITRTNKVSLNTKSVYVLIKQGYCNVRINVIHASEIASIDQ